MTKDQGPETRQRAFRYRFYPTPEQAQLLLRQYGCARFVANWAIALRSEAWRERGERISGYDAKSMLPALKKQYPWLAEVSSVVLQEAVLDGDRAFKAFFDSCTGKRKGRKMGYPRFKTRNSKKSVRYTRSGFSWRDGAITLAKMSDPLNIVWSRPLPEGARPSSVTVSVDTAGRWHISILTEDAIEPLPVEGRAVGIDLGIKTLAVTSDDEHFENPKHFARRAARLARYQRQMARRRPKPGQHASKNYLKAKAKAGRTHARIADARRDNLHKVTTDLVNRYDIICIEDLNVAGLIKSKRMSRSICDAAWGEFRQLLTYKAQWYGKRLVVIDRFSPTSKTCSACEEVKPKLMLSEREWTCTGCGTLHDRDLNAAKNILAAGLAVLDREAQEACGEDVRPEEKPRASSRKGRQPSVKQEAALSTRRSRVSAA